MNFIALYCILKLVTDFVTNHACMRGIPSNFIIHANGIIPIYYRSNDRDGLMCACGPLTYLMSLIWRSVQK